MKGACLGVILMLAPFLADAGGDKSKRDKKPASNPEEKAISKMLEELAAAFNKRDAAGVAACWSEGGVYRSTVTGEKLVGPKAIEKDYADLFKRSKGLRLTLDLRDLRLVTTDVALAEGLARIERPDQEPTFTTFAMSLVKKGERWRLDSVRETDLPEAESHFDQLKELDALTGDWHYKDADAEVLTSSKWVANKNFISRRYTVIVDGAVQHEGTQIIGWDPLQRRIRSWTFDSDGSFGEGFVEKNGKGWSIKASGVLPGGQVSTATQIITPVDGDHYTWQVIARSVDGEILPNVEPVRMTRKAKGRE